MSKDSVRTPKYIINALRREFKVRTFYDPTPYNPNFKKGSSKDALLTEWGPVSFINPPYSNVKPFFEKAHEQWRKKKTIIMLCKLSNLATPYAQQFAKGAELRILNRRIIFPGYSGMPRFNSALVIWRAGKRSNKYSVVEMKKP